jgi:hypothetical protein
MWTDEQMDGHDEANSRFSQFTERAEKTLGMFSNHIPRFVGRLFFKQRQTLIPVSEAMGVLAELTKVCLMYEQ